MAAVADAGIVQWCNVWMRQRREDVALALEALAQRTRQQMCVRQLQGNGSVERTVVAHGEPHLSHTTTSELAHELIRSNDGARFKAVRRSAVHIVACGRELGKRLEEDGSFGGCVP